MIPYVYKWTHLPTFKWYVGSRTAKNCHPHHGYLSSSKIVKPLIQASPTEWKKEIIALGTIEEMRELETTILTLMNAARDPRSFNRHNAIGCRCSGHTDETIKKIKDNHHSKKDVEAYSAGVSKRSKESWADPLTRENRLNSLQKVSKQIGASVKALWQDPSYRERLSNSHRGFKPIKSPCKYCSMMCAANTIARHEVICAKKG